MVRTCTSLAAFLAALASSVAAPARADLVDHGRTSMSGSVLNPCNGELVTYEGEEHLTYAVVDDGAGGYHASSHAAVTTHGEGSLDNAYVGSGETHHGLDAKPPFPSMARLSNTVSVVGTGSAPGFFLTFSWLVTIDADGEITAYLYDTLAECPAQPVRPE